VTRTPSSVPLPPIVDAWADAVLDRHMGGMTTSEFLKAVRALSARYVERRSELGARSPIDSAGKRAAFAGFYAPLHLVTTWHACRALSVTVEAGARIVDLGCGTGVCAAAAALAAGTSASIVGVDIDAWSLGEAAWNWRTLGLAGRTSRGQMIAPAPRRPRAPERDLYVLGWSANELPPDGRDRLLDGLVTRTASGASLLVLEPVARSAAPWWPAWAERVTASGGRADEWAFDVPLPGRLRELDRAAGFRRDTLGVRTLFVPGRHAPGRPA
jgi:hypothetical protein